METKELIEGNKLIAEFCMPQLRDKYINPENNKKYKLQDLQFHSSWDWLMPVVESIHIKREVKEVVIRPGRTRIWLKESFIESPCLPNNNSITECWIACVEFIKWFNKNKATE